MNQNKTNKVFLSKEIRSCEDWHVYRLVYFENKGYVLSIFNLKSESKEKEYKKRYIESSKPPEDIKENSEVFKELEKQLDYDIEKYYKNYTDIEHKSKWDSPKKIAHTLLNDLKDSVKYNREPDTNGEKELDKIIEDGFKIYIPPEKVKEKYTEAENNFNNGLSIVINSIDKLEYIQQYYPDKLPNKNIKHSIEAIKRIETATNLKNNPLYEYYKTSKKYLERLSSLQIEEEFNIKRTMINKSPHYFYLNNKGFYEEIDRNNLTLLIKNKFNLNIDTDTALKLLKGVINNYEVNNNYIVAKNGLINKTNGKLKENKEFLKDNLILDTLRKETDGNIILLNYHEDAKLFNGDNQTLVEKTLKEVCIPKNNKEYTKIYIDRLQRLGANILGRKKKSIAYYYTQKQNTGKSALRSLTSLVNDCAVIHPSILGDNFNYEVIGGKKAIIIDETKKGQLEKHTDDLKLFSSPDPRRDQRGIYTAKKINVKYGNLEIYTNYLIRLNIDELALFDRIDVIELPNHFVEKNKIKTVKNSYIIDENLFDNDKKIENDIEGLSWLASVSIQEYLKMEQYNKTFACRQSEEETRNILLNVDHLTNFISRYTEVDEENFTTNKEICIRYKQYSELKGLPVKEDNLATQVGYTIKELYGDDMKVRNDKGVKYKLKLKSMEEVETEFKQVWVTDEDNLTEKQVEVLDKITGDSKLIFNSIKDGKYNTINKLLNQYPTITVLEHVKTLERLGLIYNTFITRIN